MHNAYCDADENSLDLRIHPKQHTTCASVRGKRSRSYNYGYVVLVLSYIHHHRQRQQAPWAPKADMSITNWRVYPARAILIATQVWSPAQVSLKAQVERVQRRATKWILQTRIGEMSCRDRQTDLLPSYSLLPTTETWKTWYSFISAYLIIFTLMYAFASIPAIWINNFFNNFIWFIT